MRRKETLETRLTYNPSSECEKSRNHIQYEHYHTLQWLEEDGSEADKIYEDPSSSTEGCIPFKCWCFAWPIVLDQNDGKSKDGCRKEELDMC
jgi:hypothetical protein